MATRSARSPERRRHREEEDGEGVADFLFRHRGVVGGVTAFLVAFSYVGANALWYQPHAHGSALFSTRGPSLARPQPAEGQDAEVRLPETVFRLENEEGTPATPRQPAPSRMAPLPAANETGAGAGADPQARPAPAGDPVIAEVQGILADLNLYQGDVDGLTGPQTRTAIEAYRKIVGLTVSTDIDDQLLSQLGARSRVASKAIPLPEGSPGTDLIETSSAPSRDDAMVRRIQAGLKAFGNDGIEIDGVVGSRTRSAITEFQSLFGLPETGAPDEQVYRKMREIGLTE